MSSWLRLIIIVVLIGISRAHHIRLIILAILGLAGLWLMQGGATNSGGGGGGAGKWLASLPGLSAGSVGGLATRVLSKREIPYNHNTQDNVNWEEIMANDPSSCARSFVCQLAARPFSGLSENEQYTLATIRESAGNKNFANKELYIAMITGEKSGSELHCRKIYRKCPYSRTMMLQLLELIKYNS